MPSSRQSVGRRRVSPYAPMPNRLRGPQRRTVVSRNTGGGDSYTTDQYPQRSQRSQRQSRGFPIRPTEAGEKATAGVGLLEAEFLGSIILLFILMFADKGTSYPNKIMSLMKRGTLLVFLFFILALIAGTGPNAAKVSKGIGSLVFVTTLVTSAPTSVFTSLDQFIKADWVSTGEAGSDTGASSNAGTGALSPAPGAIDRIKGIIGSLLGPLGPAGI